MAWVKVKWMDPLFKAFNTVWPDRTKEQDGTIGNLAHASGTSGHNPDDTPGVKAEREDADTKQEVRAEDVDARGVDMEAAVQAILHGPAAERDRLIYIIYNARIWRKANGWKQERYTGADKHKTHAHFSGDPASDEDARPWTSILALATVGEDESMSETHTIGQAGFTSVPMSSIEEGAWPRQAVLNICNDLGDTPKVSVRCWYAAGKAEAWAPLPGWGGTDGVLSIRSGEHFAVSVPKGCTCLSFLRVSPFEGDLKVRVDFGPIQK